MGTAILKPIVEDFLREGRNKKMPTTTAARVLHKRHPALFLSVENARNIVRGVRGEKEDTYTVVPDLVRTKEEIDSWKIRFHKPLDEGFSWHSLPGGFKYLFMADIHSPYYALKEIIVTLEIAKNQGCDAIVYNGDICDFYQLSFFCKDPRNRSFPDEVEIGKRFFDTANKFLKPKKVFWKLGNHEARFEKFVMARTPELVGLEDMTIPKIFKVREQGIEVIPESDPLRHKSLTIIHGHEYKGGFIAPVNPARGMFLRANASTVSAHQHATSEHTTQTIQGKIITCFSLGCLCNLHPKYAPFNKWNHGFGILETQSGDYWKFHNKRIIEGVVV